jgi:hypothetical protein
VKLLIDSGANIDYQNENRYTPLFSSAVGGHLAAAMALLDSGANVNHQDKDGNTALHIAVAASRAEGGKTSKTNVAFAVALVSRGADVSVRNNALSKQGETVNPLGETPLDMCTDRVKEQLEVAARRYNVDNQPAAASTPVASLPATTTSITSTTPTDDSPFGRAYGPVLLSLQSQWRPEPWARVKARFNLLPASSTELMLQKALAAAAQNTDEDEDEDEDEDGDNYPGLLSDDVDGSRGARDETTLSPPPPPPQPVAKQLPVGEADFGTQVEKWFRVVSNKRRKMFKQRLVRLLDGHRSYALSKRLTNVDAPVYEAKLDTGWRILWSKLWREASGTTTILVWAVCSHDDVPRYLRLIEASQKRFVRPTGAAAALVPDDRFLGSKQQHSRDMPAATFEGARDGEGDAEAEAVLRLKSGDELIDPESHRPLRATFASRAELAAQIATATAVTADDQKRESWYPRLRLSSAQRALDKQLGSVTVLGRSGTGKTLCLSDRMSRDRIVDEDAAPGEAASASNITQLFVSRGRRLLKMVRSLQTQTCRGERPPEEQLALTDFLTLDQFLLQMETAAAAAAAVSAPPSWLAGKRVDFSRFRDALFTGGKAAPLDPLVVWTQIRSFVKGSVEAALAGRPLTKDEYLAFAKDRCRLSAEQRREVYAAYERYEQEKGRRGWWDDGDRVLSLLASSRLEPLPGGAARQNGDGGRDYDRVYADEVQDYTQAEILVFILAAGMRLDSLFLAGTNVSLSLSTSFSLSPSLSPSL